ncbi:MAG TPA: sigma 54-interacting transcriptional regulator [Kofleriaceae bacterium]|jgi:DNA-binding NtrC family response regulator
MLTESRLSPRIHRFTRAGDRVRLVVIDGPDRGSDLVVTTAASRIGTGPDAALALTDPSVSRAHAEVRWTGRFVEVVDLGSKNGTFAGDVRVHRADLFSGGELRLGNTTLKVVPDDVALDPQESGATQSGALVAGSKVMRQLFTLIDQLAASDVSVLIDGETGVGKELVAEEIHRRSKRAAEPFVVVDCGAVADELIESTLFGHVRGAFTGATADRTGMFGDADLGTVFIDEVGELPLDLQPALLRVLDRRMIRPVGATAFRPIDIRVVAATHRDLGERIDAGAFREDLYYRLAVVRIAVPALRERRDDIPLLVRHFLRGSPLAVDDATMARLVAYDWPGNVRELRNAIEGAVAMSPGDTLVVGELKGRHSAPKLERAGGAAQQAFRDAKAAAIDAFERRYLTELVAGHDTLAGAADAAGMDRKHLRVLLARYGLRDR